MREELLKTLVEIRRTIHENPELGFKEVNTSELIANFLKRLGLEVQVGVGKTGVVGLLKSDTGNRTLAIRADMDAISVQEESSAHYISKHKGIMHACGHDGHVAMVLGAAVILHEMRRKLKGNVKFIFQPAEEESAGALAMIKEGVLKEPEVHAVIGVHLWPDLPVGSIGINFGPSMASSDNFWVTIRGKGSHAAMPHHGLDAIVIAAFVICGLQQIISRQIDPSEMAVLTIGTIHGGYRRNVIAEEVKFSGTVRTLNQETRKKMGAKIQSLIRGIASSYGAECEVDYKSYQPVTVNDDKLTEVCEGVINDVLGPDRVIILKKPSMAGEDFSYFAQSVPSTLLKVGCANVPKGITEPLHSPRFDFDEDALLIGAKVLAEIAKKYFYQQGQ